MTGNAGRKAARKARPITPVDKCAHCGGTKTRQIHHIDHDPMNNALSNLMVLCSSCHGRLHSNERWANHAKKRACANCGTEFMYARARKKTCSRTCGSALAWKSRA